MTFDIDSKMESIQKGLFSNYVDEDKLISVLLHHFYGSPDMANKVVEYYDKILSGDDELARQVGLDPKTLEDTRWMYKYSDEDFGYDGPDIDKQVETLEAQAAQEEAEAAAKEAQAQKTESFKDSFDINAAMVSRDQSYSAEPVQHADHEAFQRMGLFGARRKKVPAPEPAPIRPMPKPVMAGAAPETDEQRQAREADEAAFQAAKEAQPPIDNPSEGQQ